MNAAHLHLAINHLPIALPFAALILLIIGFFTRSGIVQRCAHALLVLSAISAFVTMASGDKAEELIEDKAGISHELIEEHEESAETFAFVSYGLGVLSLIGIWASWRNKIYSTWIAYGTVVAIAVVLWLATRTGESGGEINHPEIHQGT
ncbi:MAG: DUF2231 domain-containing protein [Flavobacteriales bacterium]